ncbi:MAG: HAD family acid phosphatase [Thermodesulfobacteriota bacterium]
MRECVIVDIDGTLSNPEHRLSLIENDRPDWDAFHDLCYLDEPYPDIIELVTEFANQYDIIICTDRNESNRRETNEWLNEHNVPCENMYMRTSGDDSTEIVLKEEMLDTVQSEYSVRLVIEDSEKCVEMYRNAGHHLDVLQIHADEMQQNWNFWKTLDSNKNLTNED